MSPATPRVAFVTGGAALGALAVLTFQQLTQKKASPPVTTPAKLPTPSPITSAPRQPPAGGPGHTMETIEKARSILPFGMPVPVNDLLYRHGYVASYNRRDRNPNWVCEHLTATSLQRIEGVDRGKSVFKEDDTIPAMFRARLADYFRSNFDRGHMVPAADMKQNQQAMDDTFYLTNIAPQVGDGFNRDYWAHVEQFCRSLTKQFSDVYVFTGPMYLPRQEADGKYYVKYQVIGNPPNVAVPTHFFKVILAQRQGRSHVAAFVLPNQPISDDTPLEQFRVPLDAIERGVGFTFFDGLGDHKARLGDLCRETKCHIVLSKFHEAKKRKQLALPSPQKQ